VDALLRLQKLSLEEACARALDGQRQLGGSGGLIAVDRDGRSAALFTTPAMYRGWVAGKGEPKVAIFPEE
jgi:beta-aspartyl-peptidase (threonine type)